MTDEQTPSPQHNSHREAQAGFNVNRKGFIEVTGVIEELLPAGTFRVTLENGHEILAHLAGKMRMNKIRIAVGDRVKIEMSPYDLSKGRVVYRY